MMTKFENSTAMALEPKKKVRNQIIKPKADQQYDIHPPSSVKETSFISGSRNQDLLVFFPLPWKNKFPPYAHSF